MYIHSSPLKMVFPNPTELLIWTNWNHAPRSNLRAPFFLQSFLHQNPIDIFIYLVFFGSVLDTTHTTFFYQLHHTRIGLFTVDLLNESIQRSLFDHQSTSAQLWHPIKTVVDLRTVRRIKHFGEDYIIKTDDENFTLRSKYLDKNERLFLHEFFVQYANTQEVIFPWILTSIEVLKFLK